MALRSRMHPRNIYRIPPNFKDLAIEFPEFRKHVKQELSGKVTLDYSDRSALLELTRILLLKDFNLKVEINESRLIPRIPLCLNYLLWVEDLISIFNKTKDVIGIDIGTGSTCIYSLLAAKKGWKMLATEIDKTSFENASENVRKNNLCDNITIKFVENKDKILIGVIDDLTYDFCMCNPPFFSDNEKPSNRTKRRKRIEGTSTFVNSEITVKGGEIEFIRKIVKQSQLLKNKIKIYTTLVGKKCDLTQVRKDLKAINPYSIVETEFCQGNTIRWGIAWTFEHFSLEGISYCKSQKFKKAKQKVLNYLIPVTGCTVNETLEKIQEILMDLNIQYTLKSTSKMHTFTLKAYQNTWSHQRRKIRIKKRELKESVLDKVESLNVIQNNSSEISQKSNEYLLPQKKLKLNDNNFHICENEINSEKTALVECVILIKEEVTGILLEMFWLSGHKESVHQIFQYIKNHYENLCKSEILETTEIKL